MPELPDIKIDELNSVDILDNKKDLLVGVHYSDAYSEGQQTVNFHPTALLKYDNKKSKLQAQTYQDAIDELVLQIAIGNTFNLPMSPNPNANELEVNTGTIQS